MDRGTPSPPAASSRGKVIRFAKGTDHASVQAAQPESLTHKRPSREQASDAPRRVPANARVFTPRSISERRWVKTPIRKRSPLLRQSGETARPYSAVMSDR